MKEQGGTATELCGLGADIDAEHTINRLGQAARYGIEPPIQGLSLYQVQLPENNSKVIVIQIHRSFYAPHRIKETSKFHVRHSGRNDEMNVDELRAAFNLSETYIDRIKTFRNQRVRAISDQSGHEDVPVNLTEGIRTILHVVPISFAGISATVDLGAAFNRDNYAKWLDENGLVKFVSYGRFNMDGFVLPFGRNEKSPLSGYTQIFRQGAIETVDVKSTANADKQPMVSLSNVEVWVLKELKTATIILSNLGVQNPLFIMVSITGIRGSVFVYSYREKYAGDVEELSPALNRDIAPAPDVVLEQYDDEHTQVLKPAFDYLWNCGGWKGSLHYSPNGKWTGMTL